ncbi:MAG TPA: group I intron-associated PD-(D/E)XK endonuclease [Ktedonobacteraceae bacterium]|nr:group I intron-associated PD-(D/E)XK endonuclease [Ktedonobacteraceae bacterium]
MDYEAARKHFGKRVHDLRKERNIKQEQLAERIGKSTEHISFRFLQLGYVVLTPYGGNQRYDLVIEDVEGQFWRVQCKTGWVDEEGTVIRFNTANANITGKNRQLRHYRGQCEYFALYNTELNKVYLIPVDEVGTTRANLRLTTPKNKNQYGYRMASDYEL